MESGLPPSLRHDDEIRPQASNFAQMSFAHLTFAELTFAQLAFAKLTPYRLGFPSQKSSLYQ